MNMWNNILNFIFPSSCLVCTRAGANLCLDCLEGSPRADRETEDWVFPIFDYRHPPIKKSISLLKYWGKTGLAEIFAEAMYGSILEELADLETMQNFQKPILIPIPLAPRRARKRGYNQALLICRHLIKISEKRGQKNLYLRSDVLIKPKDTAHQAEIKNRSERLKNLVGSFIINSSEVIKDRNIILIDDVTTTGATLKEARKVLKEAGAKKVIAFTVAH